MNRFIYLKDVAAVVEKIMVLQADLIHKKNAVSSAESELAETPAGYKQTIARCKVRDAESARDAVTTEINDLYNTIPAPSEIDGSVYIQRTAELRVKRKTVEARLESNTALLDAEFAALKAGPWRRKGAPMPPAILQLQAKESDIRAEIAAINRQLTELSEEIDEIDNITRRKEELYSWIEKSGPKPKWVIEHERREYADILKRCEALKKPPTYVRVC